mgnify:FL=1
MKFKDIKFVNTNVPKGKQALVKFAPYELSIIQNDISYGGDKDLYEIGIFLGEDLIPLPGITDDGDCVQGYLTKDGVEAIMKKMFLITKKGPIQAQVENLATT